VIGEYEYGGTDGLAAGVRRHDDEQKEGSGMVGIEAEVMIADKEIAG